MVCEVLSAGREAKAELKLAKEFAIAALTETRTAPTGGTVPLDGWDDVEFATTGVVVGDDGLVDVPVPLIPDAEKL